MPYKGVPWCMAYLVKKKKKHRVYYYLAKSARVNGKPRIVSRKYLGSAEKVVQILTNGGHLPTPEFSTVLDLGAVLALFDIAERLNMRETIERHVDKREQGLPVSDTVLLAAINRAVMPKSKNSFYGWYEKTVLHNCFIGADKSSLSSQGFWNNMAQLDELKIRAIEDDITSAVVRNYEISTECLLFDNTNFFTYIDTNNPATLAQRGHSKEKRSDLKIIGLSLMVSPDNNIPLFHEAYPGNKNDSKQFSEIIDLLKQRYKRLGKGDCTATLVFDRGNNDEDNVNDILKDVPLLFHIVGGLKINQCKELLGIPQKDYKPLQGDEFKQTVAYRTMKTVFGRVFTVVMTYNPQLYISQLQGVNNNIAKCQGRLQELQESLLKWVLGEVKKGRKPGIKGVTNSVSTILSAEHMKDLFKYEIQQTAGFVTFSFNFIVERFEELKTSVLGKSFLFTDRAEWTSEQIVGAYRSQYHVEEAFKHMKDPKYLTFRPIYHFTDSKIRVHAFYCVLALLLASLMNRELTNMGYKMSIHQMLDCFQAVQQVITVFPKDASLDNNVAISYSGLQGVANEYIEKFNLLRYL